MKRKINLVYTDGSHPYHTPSTKDSIYYGYHLIDSDEKEFTYTTSMNKSKYNDLFNNKNDVNSSIAELLAIHCFLSQLDSSDQNTILQDYHIFTDSEHCFHLLNRDSDRLYKKSSLLQREVIKLLKELRDKNCVVEIMWVESHKENWGNLFIDYELSKSRGSNKVISIEKKKNFRLKQILFEDYLLNSHNIEYSSFLEKLLKQKYYKFGNRKMSSNNFAFRLIEAFSNDRKLVYKFMEQYF